MPADGRTLPGYHFDPVRGRYFAIQPNHASTPQEAKYTKERVANEIEKTKKRKRSESLRKKRLEQTIDRPRMLQSLHTHDLVREIGSTSLATTLRARTHAFCSQLETQTIFETHHCEQCQIRDSVTDFAYHEEFNAVICAFSRCGMGKLGCVYRTRHGMEDGLESGDLQQETIDVMLAFSTEISSVNVTHSGAVVATALGYGNPGNVFLTGIRTNQVNMNDPRYDPEEERPAPTIIKLGGIENDVWTSAANPPGNKDLVAIGDSTSARIIDTLVGTQIGKLPIDRDVKSIAWLNPVLAVGASHRCPIFLWDIRARGSANRFSHKGGVTNIQTLNEHQIVVNGFESMAIYDVRMSPNGTFGKTSSKPYSKPLITLADGTKNDDAPVAVHPSLGLVARRDDWGKVHIYSTRDGSLMASPNASLEDWKPMIKRLRFGQDKKGNETLMACKGPRLFAWGYGGWAEHVAQCTWPSGR